MYLAMTCFVPEDRIDVMSFLLSLAYSVMDEVVKVSGLVEIVVLKTVVLLSKKI